MPSSNVLRISVAAAALVALFGGVALADVSSPSPLAARLAASDDVADDVSGPCDEAEHANDPRCTASPAASTADDDDATTTSTTVVADVTSSSPSPRTLDAAGAGTVTYVVDGASLTLIDVTLAAGWAVEVEQAAGRELDLDLRSGAQRVQVDIELEDGQVRERVRIRDDAAGTETRIEDGTVVRERSDDDGDEGDDDTTTTTVVGGDDADADDSDDSSGPGSGSDDDSDDDDDSSGSGSGSDDDSNDDDDSSGSGRGSDDSDDDD